MEAPREADEKSVLQWWTRAAGTRGEAKGI